MKLFVEARTDERAEEKMCVGVSKLISHARAGRQKTFILKYKSYISSNKNCPVQGCWQNISVINGDFTDINRRLFILPAKWTILTTASMRQVKIKHS